MRSNHDQAVEAALTALATVMKATAYEFGENQKATIADMEQALAKNLIDALNVGTITANQLALITAYQTLYIAAVDRAAAQIATAASKVVEDINAGLNKIDTDLANFNAVPGKTEVN